MKSSTPSLRGDLTKWMQEIATGVYVGNFNSRIREYLWERVKQSVGKGEATLSYAYRNEIGYQFETHNTKREVIDYDGIPLVLFPKEENVTAKNLTSGFSNAAKFRQARKARKSQVKLEVETPTYLVIDIETEGLDDKKHSILEIAALKIENDKISIFNELVYQNIKLTPEIKKLTGITEDDLIEHGNQLADILMRFKDFVGDDVIVGYGVDFDISFINRDLKRCGLNKLENRVYDLMSFVKKENMFLKDYKLQTVLNHYGIEQNVPHRALGDAKLIYQLSNKVNLFLEKLNSNG